MKLTLSIALLTACLAGIWYATSGERRGGGETVDGGRPSNAQGSEAVSLPVDLVPGAETAARPGSESSSGHGQSTSGPKTTATTEATSGRPLGPLRVIVEGQDGKPVVGAEVAFLDRRTVAAQDWQAVWNAPLDREAFIRDHGIVLQTDQNGVLEVPGTTNGAIEGRAPGMLGRAEWMGPKKSPFRFVLEKLPDLSVQVVDADGRLAGGVNVGVGINRPDLPHFVQRAKTGSDGRPALFPDLSRLIPSSKSPPGYAVGLAFPANHRELIALDVENLPEDTVELQLPATGTVTVRMSGGDDSPVGGSPEVKIGVYSGANGNLFYPIVNSPVINGLAHFPYVGVGASLTLRVDGVRDRKTVEVEHPGPAYPGEDVVIELEWGQRFPTLVGRAIDSSGTALAERRGRFFFEQGGARNGGPAVELDGNGGFRITVTKAYQEGLARTLKLDIFSRNGLPPASAELDFSYALEPGENDLGDVVLDIPPVIVAGRVVTEEGRPLLRARVSVEARAGTGEDGEPTWAFIPGSSASTDTDGYFRVWNTSEASELRVIGAAQGFKRAVSAPIAAGKQDLQLVLSAGVDEAPEQTAPRTSAAGKAPVPKAKLPGVTDGD